jgi:hypothetical protein
VSGPAHYLKPPGRPTRPGTLITVCVKTRTHNGDHPSPRCRLNVWDGATVAACRHRRGKWTPTTERTFASPWELWEFIHTFAQPKGLTYVVAPIASDCLTLAGFWERIGSPGLEPPVVDPASPRRVRRPGNRGLSHVRKMVVSGKPDIVQYTRDGKSVCWLSGRQFFDTTDNDLSGMLGGRANQSGRGENVPVRPVLACLGRATVWLEVMKRFADWWFGLDAGKFPSTIPNASMQFFRANMSGRPILVHTDAEVISLERRASHGGRATCWFHGDVVPSWDESRWPDWLRPLDNRPTVLGPAYHWDIRSTYPSVLRDNTFPVRLVRSFDNPSVSDVECLTKTFAVVADCQIQTDVPEYPHRTEFDVTYPTGTFTATLCGPELDRALADGCVKQVFRCAYYVRGKPFALFAARVLGMREAARASGDKLWEAMVKLLGNSLGGKLSQRPLGWVRCPPEDRVKQWGVDYARNADTGEVRARRYIAGLCHVRTEIPPRNGTLLACFAFLTSYARYKMRLIREGLPARSVLSQDTDGLWVTSAADGVLRAAGGGSHTASAGTLERRSQSTALRLLGPKHYHSDLGWVLAGYHAPRVSRKGTVDDTYDINPARVGTDAAPLGTLTYARRSSLADVEPGGYVGDDGWLIPWRLPMMPGDPPPVGPAPPDPRPPLF